MVGSIWWEAAGFSDVTAKSGDTFRRRETVLFEAVDDYGVAFAGAIYMLALKSSQQHSTDIRSLTAGVGRLERCEELPTTHYMNVLAENFEDKCIVDCANELAEYVCDFAPEIREIATGCFQNIIDSVMSDSAKHPAHERGDDILNWFVRDAPEGEPFDSFRLQIATRKGAAI